MRKAWLMVNSSSWCKAKKVQSRRAMDNELTRINHQSNCQKKKVVPPEEPEVVEGGMQSPKVESDKVEDLEVIKRASFT